MFRPRLGGGGGGGTIYSKGFFGERKGSRSKYKPTEKQAESYVIVMQSIRNNTLLAVTINIASSIIVHNVSQCTKETKIRQFLDIYWVQASADHCPWPYLSSAVGCNSETAGRLSRRINLKYGYPKIFRLAWPHFQKFALLAYRLAWPTTFFLFRQFWPIDIFIVESWDWFHMKACPA